MFTWITLAALAYIALKLLVSIKSGKRNKIKLQQNTVRFSNRAPNPNFSDKPINDTSTVSIPVHIKQDSLATQNEQKLYSILLQILPDDHIVHCQVSLMSLVKPADYKDNSKTWAKRMDYVITDKTTKILAVIELDDSTHRLKKRQERDCYVNGVLKGHHPLIRFETTRIYKPEVIAAKLFNEAGIISSYL